MLDTNERTFPLWLLEKKKKRYKCCLISLIWPITQLILECTHIHTLRHRHSSAFPCFKTTHTLPPYLLCSSFPIRDSAGLRFLPLSQSPSTFYSSLLTISTSHYLCVSDSPSEHGYLNRNNHWKINKTIKVEELTLEPSQTCPARWSEVSKESKVSKMYLNSYQARETKRRSWWGRGKHTYWNNHAVSSNRQMKQTVISYFYIQIRHW